MTHHEKTDSRRIILYNQNEISQSTSTREIRVEERPVIITHWNAVEGEFLCLFEFDINDCDASGLITPVRCGSGCDTPEDGTTPPFVCISCKDNRIQIDIPGRYKLIKRGVVNNAHVTMQYISSRHVA